MSGATTINGLALLNGLVALGISITCIDLSDVSGLETALGLNAPSPSPIFTGTESGITEAMVGLCNVGNTVDLNNSVPSATQIALDSKVDNTSMYRNSGVDTHISDLKVSAPDALNTLNELAQRWQTTQIT